MHTGSTLIYGAILFSIQIYGDFSGYTDIALGSAKLFGIELLTNFKFPYFSRDIAEFWRRWHVSLSSWFRDYLYIPLGGSRHGRWKSIRNILIIFIVSGLWHGANWTFIFWGFLHAMFFMPLLLFNVNRKHSDSIVAAGRMLPNFRELALMVLTFSLVTFSWIFFRSPSIVDAFQYIRAIPREIFSVPRYLYLCPYIIILLVADWFQRRNERNVLDIPGKKLRYIVYGILALLIIFHFPYINKQEFIYFKF
jgi:D-alanyl-lipoteichoic acid acyltransferase DltB (MBOAT superfamily)